MGLVTRSINQNLHCHILARKSILARNNTKNQSIAPLDGIWRQTTCHALRLRHRHEFWWYSNVKTNIMANALSWFRYCSCILVFSLSLVCACLDFLLSCRLHCLVVCSFSLASRWRIMIKPIPWEFLGASLYPLIILSLATWMTRLKNWICHVCASQGFQNARKFWSTVVSVVDSTRTVSSSSNNFPESFWRSLVPRVRLFADIYQFCQIYIF